MLWGKRCVFRGGVFSFRNLWVVLKPKGWMLGYAAVLILIYLYVNRPDGDDAVYLKMQIQPMLKSDVALKDFSDFCASGRVLENFEFFQASLSSTFKVPFLLMYYSVFPIGFLMVLPFVWRKLFLCWGMERKKIIYALLVCLFLMITWADTHRAPANFGLVRLFQGKAVYCSILVPIQLMALMNFQRNRRFSDALMAVLSFYAGMFFTPTAILCSLLMYGVTALIDLRLDWRKTFSAALSYILMISGPIMIGLLISSHFEFESDLQRTEGYLLGCEETIDCSEEDPGIYRAGLLDEKLLNTVVLKYTYGLGVKTSLAIAAMIYMVFRVKKRFVCWYTIIFFSLLFFPLSSDLFSKAYASFSWRWLWCYPIIPVVAWSVIDMLSQIGKRSPFAAIGISLLLFIVYTSNGRTILYRSNGSHGTRIEFSPIKLFEGRELRNPWTPVVEDYWLIYYDHKL